MLDDNTYSQPDQVRLHFVSRYIVVKQLPITDDVQVHLFEYCDYDVYYQNGEG